MGIVAPEVGASRPALARTDAVMPIVGVREAAPRPAHHARVDEAERIDQRLPEPADVRDTGLLTHPDADVDRSEEHTSELQSQSNLVCRLLLEKKKTASDN